MAIIPLVTTLETAITHYSTLASLPPFFAQETGLETIRAAIAYLNTVVGPVGQFQFVCGLTVYTSAGVFPFLSPIAKAALNHSVISGMFTDTAATVSFLQSQFSLPAYFNLPYKSQIGVNHLTRVTDYIAPCNPGLIIVDKYGTFKLEIYLDLIRMAEETQEFIDIGFFLN
jgi:hypothetical protein